MKKLLQTDLRATVLLTAVTALFFWPVWIADYTFPYGGGDLWGQLYPIWSYMARWIRHGVFPLWGTHIMAGDPIIAEAQYGLLNPLNWPLFLFYPIPGTLVLLRGIFPMWWAGLGLYFYLRHSRMWQLRPSAALTGAIAYMFCDAFVIHLGHPQFNDAMSWLPWALWATEHAARRSRAIPAGAFTLAMIIVSGHGQASLYSALAVGLWGCWQVFDRKWQIAFRRAGRLALVGALAVAMVTPMLLPGFERLPHTIRASMPDEVRRGAELNLANLVDFITPLYHGRGARNSWLGWARMETGYLGLSALLLIPLGLIYNLKRPRAWFTLLLGTVAFAYALGYAGPLYPRLAHIPIFAESWRTVRAVFVLSFALACGAALGIQALNKAHRPFLGFWAMGIGITGVSLWINAPHWASQAPQGPPQLQALRGFQIAASICWICAGSFGLAMWKPKVGQSALLLLLAIELIALGSLVETEKISPTAQSFSDTIAYLQQDTGWFRVDVDAAARGLWSPAVIQAAGFDVPQSTGNPMDLNHVVQFYWSIPHKGAPAYQLFSTKYIIVPKNAAPGASGIWPVYLDNPVIDIHLNTNAMNRIWMVYTTQVVTNTGAGISAVLAQDFNPTQIAVLENGPQLQGEGIHTLEVIAYNPNYIRFAVNTSETGVLILSDIDYPGWKAYIDNQTTPIYRTNGVFRGVVVTAGTHIITMRFLPQSLKWGRLCFSLAATIILFILYKYKMIHIRRNSAVLLSKVRLLHCV